MFYYNNDSVYQKSAYFVKKIRRKLENFRKHKLKKTDAVIKIVRACVCVFDLGRRRISECQPGPEGHEAIGMIEEVGEGVKDFKVGDFVVVPFTHGFRHCKNCSSEFEANCPNAIYGVNGGLSRRILSNN